MLEAAVQFGPVGPRWLFAARGYPPGVPDELLFPDVPPPWQIVRPAEGGLLLTDDHFPAEVHWARIAMQWRRLYTVAALLLVNRPDADAIARLRKDPDAPFKYPFDNRWQ